MESHAQSKKRKMSTDPMIGHYDQPLDLSTHKSCDSSDRILLNDNDQPLDLSIHKTCESSDRILSAKNATSEIPQGIIPCSGESQEVNLLCDNDKAGVPCASGKETSYCRICNRDINAHRNFHEGMDVFKCCFCKYITDITHNLVLHIATHGTDCFFCMVCNDRFKEKGSHDSQQTCRVCEKKFLCKSLLLEHSLIHKFHCIICWKTIREHDPKYKVKVRYDCCKCEFKTNKMSNLRIHFLTHFEEKAYGCDKCLKRYKSKHSLNEHQQTCQTKE